MTETDTYIVVCETPGCANEGRAIEIPSTTEVGGEFYPISAAFCGPCGNPLPLPGGGDPGGNVD